MRSHKLIPETLAVESFVTGAPGACPRSGPAPRATATRA